MNDLTRLLTCLFAISVGSSAVAAQPDACQPAIKYQPVAGLAFSSNGSGGIGGTGHGDENRGNGTGGIGGTGIVGTITGFASICVNGLEIHFDASTPVSESLRPASQLVLAVGQQVVVEATTGKRGLEARRIEIVHALEGPVTRLDTTAGRIEVMGVEVTAAAQIRREDTDALMVGDWVQVDGHPAPDGGILASRIAPIDRRSEATVTGRSDPANGTLGGVAATTSQTGEFTAHGQWAGNRLTISRIVPAAGRVWSSRPDLVVIEARVLDTTGGIHTSHPDIDAALSVSMAGDPPTPGSLIRLTGRFDNEGRLRPITIERAERDFPNKHDGAVLPASYPASSQNDNRGRPEQIPSVKGNDRPEKPVFPTSERQQIDRPERATRPEGVERTARTNGNAAADRPVTNPSTDRPTANPGTDRPATNPGTDRPTANPSTDRPATNPSTDRPTANPSTDRPTANPSTDRVVNQQRLLKH